MLENLLSEIERSFASARAVQVVGASPAWTQLLVLLQAGAKGRVILVLPDHKAIMEWSNYLESFSQLTVAVLPYLNIWGNDRFANQMQLKKQRLFALSFLAQEARSGILLTTAMALAQKTLPKETFLKYSLFLQQHEEHQVERIEEYLLTAGYRSVNTVEEEGTFALRGGIVDIYSPSYSEPFRLEFFADQLRSIRFFAPSSQRSHASVESVRIFPASEILPEAYAQESCTQEIYNALLKMDQLEKSERDAVMQAVIEGHRFVGLEQFFPVIVRDALPASSYVAVHDLLVFPRSLESCLETYAEFSNDLNELYKKDVAAKRPVVHPVKHFVGASEMQHFFNRERLIEVGNPIHDPQKTQITAEMGNSQLRFTQVSAQKNSEQVENWLHLLKHMTTEASAKIIILARQKEQIDRLKTILQHREIEFSILADSIQALTGAKKLKAGIWLGFGEIDNFLWLESEQSLILPEHVLFGVPLRTNKPASKKLQNYLSSFKELKTGDLVVHIEHGIGRYTGITSFEVSGVTSDFLVLEYQGGDKIYLPVDKLSLLQRYTHTGAEHKYAPLDKLKSGAWERKKARVKKSVKDMADKLLKIHAERKLSPAPAFSQTSDEYFKFESEFAYEETDDQARAIHDVQGDISRTIPMDRLICGDVGFGKTEVAIRAAYRTVLDGYQVLVLVPTTVLCYQHYRNFLDRFEKHGIKVAQANRFVSASDMREALTGLENGSVDILVGTHRILSKDIKPKRLGLLVVDEEQRFGVAHKERIVELRANCHVLTMTATPIPRTLHMAMLGLRDISIISTPPQDRLSVKTYVSKFDDGLIVSAINQEVERGGQVFFVHNRVEDINEMRSYLQNLLPKVGIRVAHGQMPEHGLESVIVDFLEQKFSVLLCTTIIESGIDMPNVNTLIVNRADRFGLSQLYQIRGRVGRSSRQAYAYFLTPNELRVADEAKQRLDILSAHQELGAGFQIASYDLEFRGAGNLLGAEQSGHALDVGLELYTQMLEEAILELKGKPLKAKIDTEIKIPIAASIPKSFISQENLRLQLYKNIFSVESDTELDELRKEVEDRYGSVPQEVELLFKVAKAKYFLSKANATMIAPNKQGTFDVKFTVLGAQQVDKILTMVKRQPTKYRIAPDHKMVLNYKAKPEANMSEQARLLDDLVDLIKPIAYTLEDATTN